jgi:hypothetical protein
MKTVTFKNWILTELNIAFKLKQVWNSDLMKSWEEQTFPISEAEKNCLLKLQRILVLGGRAWNETELQTKFVGPVIMLSDVNDEEIGYFLERSLSATIGDYELSGVVDGIIASGFREPRIPFFCLHEYKRGIENQGEPEAQVLAAMLVAREKNNNEKPIYGLFIIGLIWNFVILNGNEYCISHEYKATDDELFDIFNMLKALKIIIKTNLLKHNI